MTNDLVVKANDLFRNGKYKEALKLLNGLEGNDRNAPSVLLMLLCSYQVINTEELLKKADFTKESNLREKLEKELFSSNTIDFMKDRKLSDEDLETLAAAGNLDLVKMRKNEDR